MAILIYVSIAYPASLDPDRFVCLSMSAVEFGWRAINRVKMAPPRHRHRRRKL
jgi:hypothetical protein